MRFYQDFVQDCSARLLLHYSLSGILVAFLLRQSFGCKSSSARIYSQGVGSNLLVSSVLFDLFEKFVTMVSIV